MKLKMLSEEAAVALATKYGEWIKLGYTDREQRLRLLLRRAETPFKNKVKELIRRRYKELLDEGND